MEHNDINYFKPPLTNEEFSGFKMDEKYALPDGIVFIPIEFGEENNDLLFNSANDCQFLA